MLLLVVLTGDVEPGLMTAIDRHLAVEIVEAIPDGDTGFVAVVVRDGMPSGLIDDPRLQALVLVEPVQQLHDLTMRRFAGRHRPTLDVVQYVMERLHAERTWAQIQALALGVWKTSVRSPASGPGAARLVDGVSERGGDSRMPFTTLAGETLGCIGYGQMARFVSESAALAGMNVIYWPQVEGHSEGGPAALRAGAVETGFVDVLAGSDVIMLDLVDGEDAVRLIDADALAQMRDRALLVNTSHSRAVDEGSLLQALRGGLLAGAALDRFNYEPLPRDSPLLDLPNVLLTPGVTVPAADTVRAVTARQIARLVSSRFPEAGYRDVRVHRRRRVPDTTRSDS